MQSSGDDSELDNKLNEDEEKKLQEQIYSLKGIFEKNKVVDIFKNIQFNKQNNDVIDTIMSL